MPWATQTLPQTLTLTLTLTLTQIPMKMPTLMQTLLLPPGLLSTDVQTGWTGRTPASAGAPRTPPLGLSG
jgi:hypothetical protein